MKNYIEGLRGLNTSKYLKQELEMYKKHLQEAEDKINFVSDLLKKTITLTVGAAKDITPTEESIEELFKPVKERESQNGKPEMYLDNDIWNWFPDFQKGHQKFISNSFMFLKNITNANILKEGEKIGLKTTHTFVEALSTIIQSVLDGELDNVGTWKIAYFEAKNKEGKTILYRFLAYRDGDGRLSVGVSGVNSGNEWDAGDSAYFSNKESHVLESSKS